MPRAPEVPPDRVRAVADDARREKWLGKRVERGDRTAPRPVGQDGFRRDPDVDPRLAHLARTVDQREIAGGDEPAGVHGARLQRDLDPVAARPSWTDGPPHDGERRAGR